MTENVTHGHCVIVNLLFSVAAVCDIYAASNTLTRCFIYMHISSMPFLPILGGSLSFTFLCVRKLPFLLALFTAALVGEMKSRRYFFRATFFSARIEINVTETA